MCLKASRMRSSAYSRVRKKRGSMEEHVVCTHAVDAGSVAGTTSFKESWVAGMGHPQCLRSKKTDNVILG